MTDDKKLTHEEKLQLAKERHGKPFKTETPIDRNTPPSTRLKEIIKKATERRLHEYQAAA